MLEILDHAPELTRVAIGATYALQLVELIFLPVPSSFSTYSLITRNQDQARADKGSRWRLLLLTLCASGALVGALIPLFYTLAPRIVARLGLLYPPTPATCLAGTLLLTLGSAMTLVAVLTLRRGGRFDAAGESELLITTGIFALLRHPIGAGLGLIYLGFLLLVPSPGVGAGLILFAINSRLRMAAEERELHRRFGEAYRTYAERVGALGINLSGY